MLTFYKSLNKIIRYINIIHSLILEGIVNAGPPLDKYILSVLKSNWGNTTNIVTLLQALGKR